MPEPPAPPFEPRKEVVADPREPPRQGLPVKLRQNE